MLKLTWKYFLETYYSFKDTMSSTAIEQQIGEIVFNFRTLLFTFFPDHFNIPKNHAVASLQFERTKFGPCRWWETSAKESKHRYYREATNLAPNTDIEFYICKQECRLHFFRFLRQGTFLLYSQ